MPINNVINTNRISELLKGSTVKRTQIKNLPSYMKMTGSIFDAPGVKDTIPQNPMRVNISELNAKQSLKDLEEKKPKSNGKGGNDFSDIGDAASGKAAITSGRKIEGQTKAYTKKAEDGGKIVQEFNSGALKLDRQINNDDKKFQAKFKAEEKELKANNQRLAKLAAENNEHNKAVVDAQHELDNIIASNSFQSNSSNGVSSGNQQRVAELQQFIGAKVGLMQNNGKVIYSLQRNQTRTLRNLNRTNRQYIQVNNRNQKNLKTQETKTNKVVALANKVEQYSAMAQSAGQAINIAGIGLVALGQGLASTLFGAGAGAALITIGTVMQKVGKVVELVGQYGQCAAGLTKTAAYAAEGNIMGAMMSAASAMQSGAAAVSGTKNIKGEFGKINQEAIAAKENVVAKKEAKNIVNNMSEEDIEKAGGKKNLKKYVTNDLKNKMSEDESLRSMGDIKNKAKELHNNYFEKTEDGKLVLKDDNLKEALRKSEASISDTKYASYTQNDDGSWSSAEKPKKHVSDKKVQKEKMKLSGKNFRNEIPKVENNNPIDFGKAIQALGSSATNIAGVFMQNNAMEQMSKRSNKNLQPYQMDARTRMIMERNQRYRRHASYV